MSLVLGEGQRCDVVDRGIAIHINEEGRRHEPPVGGTMTVCVHEVAWEMLQRLLEFPTAVLVRCIADGPYFGGFDDVVSGFDDVARMGACRAASESHTHGWRLHHDPCEPGRNHALCLRSGGRPNGDAPERFVILERSQDWRGITVERWHECVEGGIARSRIDDGTDRAVDLDEAPCIAAQQTMKPGQPLEVPPEEASIVHSA